MSVFDQVLSGVGAGGPMGGGASGGAGAALSAAGAAGGTAVGLPPPVGAAITGQLYGLLTGALKGGGHGNPDSAFSVGRQTIRVTALLAEGRWDDADRASELFFSTGRGVAEKARYKPGLPWDLGGGVKNYSQVAHHGGHQKLPRLTDEQIIAYAPGGKYVPTTPAQPSAPASPGLAVVPAVPPGGTVAAGAAPAVSGGTVLVAAAAVLAVKVLA